MGSKETFQDVKKETEISPLLTKLWVRAFKKIWFKGGAISELSMALVCDEQKLTSSGVRIPKLKNNEIGKIGWEAQWLVAP